MDAFGIIEKIEAREEQEILAELRTEGLEVATLKELQEMATDLEQRAALYENKVWSQGFKRGEAEKERKAIREEAKKFEQVASKFLRIETNRQRLALDMVKSAARTFRLSGISSN